jgi:hypothetical protein
VPPLRGFTPTNPNSNFLQSQSIPCKYCPIQTTNLISSNQNPGKAKKIKGAKKSPKSSKKLGQSITESLNSKKNNTKSTKIKDAEGKTPNSTKIITYSFTYFSALSKIAPKNTNPKPH